MSTNDKKIDDTLEAIEKKITALGERPSQKYSYSTSIDIDGTVYNVRVLDLLSCVALYNSILLVENTLADAMKALGCDEEAISKTLNEIKEKKTVIEERANQLQWQTKYNKLNKAKEKLTELLSNEAKTTKMIDSLIGELGDL